MTRRQAILCSAGSLFSAPLVTPRNALGAGVEAICHPEQIGRIAFDVSDNVDNGNSVPFGVSVDSPMTPGDHVTQVLLFAEGNPEPRVAVFHFTPMSGRAQVATRIRLSTSQQLLVIARTSRDVRYLERKYVQVSIAGCTG